VVRVVLATSGLLLAIAAHAAPVPKRVVKDEVAKFFISVEKGRGNTSVFWGLPQEEVVRELGTYFEHESSLRRSMSVIIAASVGRHAKEPAARSLATDALLNHATGADGGKKRNAVQALEGLLAFKKADFRQAAGAAVETLVRSDDPHPSALLLAGILGLKSVADDLKKLSETIPGRPRFENPSWSAHLALGRLGEAASVKHCVERVENELDAVQRVRHFPELAFLRHADGLKSLTGFLESDARLPGAKPADPGPKVALRALTAMAEVVEGFPVKADLTHTYTDAQLAAARKWVKEQKELKWKE